MEPQRLRDTESVGDGVKAWIGVTSDCSPSFCDCVSLWFSSRAFVLVCALLILGTNVAAQGRHHDREEIVVIHAGEIITGTGESITNGKIVIIDGEIAAVGRMVEYPRTARVIDASHEVVMPGLIDVRTRYGLPSYSRSGQRAHLKAADEVYPELIDFEELLRHGYTGMTFVPSGTGIPGRAAVYRTAGPDEHRVLRETAYLRITMSNPARDKGTLRTALRNAQREIDKVEKAREEWEKKQEEAKQAEKKDNDKNENENENNENADNSHDKPEEPTQFTPPEIEESLRPLVDLIKREPGVVALIELSNASDLLHTEDVIQRYENLPVMFYLQPGQGDFHHVVEELGERSALIVTGPNMARLPFTVQRYNLVAELFRVGAEVAILPSSSLEAMRPQLADLIRSGLRHDEAIRAITINAARVAGVDDRLGTIEAEKHADLIFLDSHPLDGFSQVTRTMIRGEIVWSSGD